MRKDNELLILAKEGLSKELFGYVPIGKQNTKELLRSPLEPLHGTFRDYVTEIDVSSPCEVLPPDYQAHLDKPLTKKEALDLTAYRAWCEQLDKDMESDNPPF